MAQNMFEELSAKKAKIKDLAIKAKAFGWIDEGRMNEIIDKLDNDTLTIGVIGQMKCGKSTFLNAFVFEDDVLPSATTPMTAALSVITYGEKKTIKAEFYTEAEWQEQKMMAARPLEGLPESLESSKIKAAKELVEKSAKLGGSISQYLGKTQEDSFDNLIEYVGADGKFISITKAVTIYYPKEYLKGVEIVDTPGFNDPIVSREERTKDFLKKADVVLLMLYAGRPFDATDRTILFENVRQCGIGKVVVGVNKYDIPYENGEGIEEIKQYVQKEIRNACTACNDDKLVQILKDTEPILLSAEMALLSELPMCKISATDSYQFAWNRACDNFEISNQTQMRQASHLEDLTSAVKSLVENEKGAILFAKPLNAINAAGLEKQQQIASELQQTEGTIAALSMPNDEREEKLEQLTKAVRRMNKKLDSLGDDLESDFNNVVRTSRNELEDAVDATCKRMRSIIDGWGRFSKVDTILPQLDNELQNLTTRTLKRMVENISQTTKSKVKTSVQSFFDDAEDILMRYVDHIDTREFVKKVENKINIDIENGELFSWDNTSDEEESSSFWEDVFYFMNGFSYGALGLITNALSHDETKNKLLGYVTNISGQFDPNEYLQAIFESKESVIEAVKKAFIDDMLTPLTNQMEECVKNAANDAENLKKAKDNLDKLKNQSKEIEEQMVIINSIL